jgi:vitamin B12 transporter
MKFCTALAGVVLATHPGIVFAQSNAVRTEPIVVTAVRSPQTADAVLASVTVITRNDIERRQPQDIADLLRTQAGIDITRSGGPGGDIALFMRGTNSNHTLVLIDGVRVASSNTGTFDWRNLALAQIERIEIVRGPRASLYGSDAIGGVIQIFTRRPHGTEVALGAGSRDTQRADVAWGGDGVTRAFATASHFDTEGFSSQNEHGSSFDPDNDGERVQSLSAGLNASPRSDTHLSIIGRQSRGSAQFDIGESDLANESLNARIVHATTDAWTQTLSLGLFHDALVTRSAFPSDIRTQRRTLDWQNDIALDPGSTATFGLAYAGESGTNVDPSIATTLFDREQHSRAAFALWQQQFGSADVELAGRYDDYSSFGGHGTWSAAYGWIPWGDARAWASYGTGFRAPSLNDLFHPGFGGFFAGNPNLQPERSRSAELGLRQRGRAGDFAASLFATRIDDLIAFEGPMSQAINVDKASVRGAELEHSYKGEHWYLATAITLQRARNETTDTPLLRRPNRKISLLVERELSRGAVGAELVAASKRRDIGGDVAGYGIVNLAAHYALRRFLSLEARLENAFDKQYQLIDGFNTPGRSVFVTLRYQVQVDDAPAK